MPMASDNISSSSPARLPENGRMAGAVATGLALVVAVACQAANAQTLLSQGRPAVSSSNETSAFPASNGVDGNTATRWSSQFSDPQWIYVDLGSVASVTRVVLQWEAAYGKAYQIQVSNDAGSWTTIFSTSTGSGGVNDLSVAGSGRYVRVNGTQRGTAFGYSLFELQVYGSTGQQAFGGSPRPIPGTIQAEDYDTGGEGVAFHDTTAGNSGAQYRSDGVDIETSADAGGGFDVGWTAPGEWLEYTVNVTAAGAYAVSARVASLSAGGTLHVEVDGQNVTGAMSFGATGGWQTWTTVSSSPVTLAAGPHVVRLALEAGAFNVNWIRFAAGGICTTMPSAPTGLTSPSQTSNSVSLSWNPSPAGANCTVQYRIFQNGAQVAQVAATVATIGSLLAGTGYSFTVVAIDEAGSSAQSSALSVRTASGAVDLGPNVLVFDPSMSASAIQSQINGVYGVQQGNQFGTARNALLFKPGSYAVDVPVGFYTQVLGLGQSPDQVSITSAHSDAFLSNNNATCNFWRAVENFAEGSAGSTIQWAVSQAAPFRRMHVKGNLVLHQNGGWASGGWISDSKIDGNVGSGPQQQFLSRNAQWGSWTGSNWNMVFVGVVNPPPGTWPNPAYTTVAQTPIVREKPYLYLNGGEYAVFVPSLRTNSQGITWAAGPTPGTSLPIDQFYVAKAGTDTAASLNAALGQGKNLLLTPGIYHLNDTLRVTRAGAIVLGLGYATLHPDTGLAAMTVADVDGVILAGLLFDAGATSSPVLLEVGPSGSSAAHAANPTSLHDLFFRVGGAEAGKANVSLRINSNNVIGDHFWLWRADHGSGVGWTSNTAANGLVVNGNNVTIYGLFVEHYQQFQTLWNGSGGRTYFYQSELPYDPPNQASWTSGSGVNGWASYKVAGTAGSHEAWGLGIYAVFSNGGVNLSNSIEAPSNGTTRLHDMVTVSISGNGTITHIVNGVGGTANPSVSSVPRLTDYP
jgi:hypothetical protein